MEEKVRKSERTKICQNKLKKEKELKISPKKLRGGTKMFKISSQATFIL
jgi:hypothetical protein